MNELAPIQLLIDQTIAGNATIDTADSAQAAVRVAEGAALVPPANTQFVPGNEIWQLPDEPCVRTTTPLCRAGAFRAVPKSVPEVMLMV